MYLGTGEGDKLSSLTSSSTQSCRRFSLAEIQSATENFGDELVIGQGGFGKVYKEPFQRQSNLDGFAVVLAEVLIGAEISYENDQKIDELLVQHGKMPLRRIARVFFEMCNEVDS